MLEITLVLALMVVMAAIAWPSMRTAFETRRLKTAAEQLRADFGAARVEAMTSGLIQALRCESEGRRCTVKRGGGPVGALVPPGFGRQQTGGRVARYMKAPRVGCHPVRLME